MACLSGPKGRQSEGVLPAAGRAAAAARPRAANLASLGFALPIMLPRRMDSVRLLWL